MFAVDLQIGFDDPVVAIVARALKNEGVGPNAPLLIFIEVTFGAADGFVDECQAAGEADAAGTGVEFQEFLVRQVCNADGFVCGRAGGHLNGCGRIDFYEEKFNQNGLPLRHREHRGYQGKMQRSDFSSHLGVLCVSVAKLRLCFITLFP